MGRKQVDPHIVQQSTISALAERRNGSTMRHLAASLGLPESAIGSLSDVLHNRPNAVTRENENDLRRRLGLPVVELSLAPICPHHGIVHAVADCGGVSVEKVTVLQPGQKVTRIKPRKPEWLPVAVAAVSGARTTKTPDGPRVYARGGKLISEPGWVLL